MSLDLPPTPLVAIRILPFDLELEILLDLFDA